MEDMMQNSLAGLVLSLVTILLRLMQRRSNIEILFLPHLLSILQKLSAMVFLFFSSLTRSIV